ncbi:unnamed protein product [Oikopleura dioica]|uniref:Uncharacterized protein n=1 Tax=Oikopleura dioica TaxID=34765 RepID=E4Y5D3_OIKDI|nr:unnamed protein product [Oikopleura dioica]
MNSSGQIYATEQFGKECKFKENVFENYWCFYSSIEFKNPESGKLYYFGMNKKGNPIRGRVLSVSDESLLF